MLSYIELEKIGNKMVRNKLEKLFSASCKVDRDLWFMKLHNNMLAHQTTPADYILTVDRAFKPKTILVECKQVTCEDGTGKGRFAFKRLKQLHDLISFETLRHFHESYLCLGYYAHGWTNSAIYLVPIYVMQTIIAEHKTKSLNSQDAETILKSYKIKIKNKVMDLCQLK